VDSASDLGAAGGLLRSGELGGHLVEDPGPLAAVDELALIQLSCTAVTVKPQYKEYCPEKPSTRCPLPDTLNEIWAGVRCRLVHVWLAVLL
jgi:hypothetical protein